MNVDFVEVELNINTPPDSGSESQADVLNGEQPTVAELRKRTENLEQRLSKVKGELTEKEDMIKFNSIEAKV